MTAVATLATLLTRNRFSASPSETGSPDDIALLTRLGLVTVEQSRSIALCTACDLDHSASIVAHHVSGEVGWFCPEAGFVKAQLADCDMVRADPDRLVALLAGGLECRRRRQAPLIENKLWRVGAFDFEEQDVTVYLALDLADAEKAGEVASALMKEAGLRRGLILTPMVSGSPGLSISRSAISALDELIDLGAHGLTAERRHAAALAGVELRRRGGRPEHPRRAEAEELIRRRHRAGDACGSKRAEARAVLQIMGEGAPGATTLHTLIEETWASTQ